MKKKLITCALPYVNNIPHLGNMLQVLSADIYARYARMGGYETLYICGTDEYGTASETRARQAGITPQELCDQYHEKHKDIYTWFGIAFDYFGRTSVALHSEITRDIFYHIEANGYIVQQTSAQLYSEASAMFLADRYVQGICPYCGYNDARGDQCEACGKLLEPHELQQPRSVIDGTEPVLRETQHLYLNLPLLAEQLRTLIDMLDTGSSNNVQSLSHAWIRDGLHMRAITRDLSWGVSVPGYENKVFYVWFDAPIGYISMTMACTDDWQSWWHAERDAVDLVQFLGKDNILFHTILFPATLRASGQKWTSVTHISATEYLNYETGKFSKSRGIGVFGTDIQNSGIEADAWRFYLHYVRPENSDYTFSWDDFQAVCNRELGGNIGNLLKRCLSMYISYFGNEVKPCAVDAAIEYYDYFDALAMWDYIHEKCQEIIAHYEALQLRRALHQTIALASYLNKVVQDKQPWHTYIESPLAVQFLLWHVLHGIRDVFIVLSPCLVHISERVLMQFFTYTNESASIPLVSWQTVGNSAIWNIASIQKNEDVFTLLDDALIASLRLQCSGQHATESHTKKTRDTKKTYTMEQDTMNDNTVDNIVDSIQKKQALQQLSKKERIALEDAHSSDEERFLRRIELRVARIVSVELHPNADSLYVLHLDDGSDEGRVIVSGLVAFYQPDELCNHNIIVVSNLKPAKLRGVKSNGMLLAVSEYVDDTESACEVIMLSEAPVGSIVGVQGYEHNDGAKSRIDTQLFFDIPLYCRDGIAYVGNSPLCVGEHVLQTYRIVHGHIG